MDFDSVITKGGDEGYTSLGIHGRVSKGGDVVSLLGEADELQVRIGWVILHAQQREFSLYDSSDIDGYQQLGILQDISTQSTEISKQLWQFMGSIATGVEVKNNLQQLEEWSSAWMPTERITQFSIPGEQDDLISMSAHSARTQARKVEREIIRGLLPASSAKPVQEYMRDLTREWLPWFNRLSDYYYLLTTL